MKNEVNNEKKKLTIKERLKDKRERAKIELIAYGVFFIGVIIFARVLGSTSSKTESNNQEQEQTFINAIEDNYEYDIQIIINENTHEYYGKVLGNNSVINFKNNQITNTYYQTNNEYYILEDENYILTDEKEVYPYIDNRYLNINNIKQYIKISTKDNNTYKVKISDIVLNNTSEEYITIKVEEGDNNIIIDYTSLFKLTNKDIETAVVNITYSNINNIISLEE